MFNSCLQTVLYSVKGVIMNADGGGITSLIDAMKADVERACLFVASVSAIPVSARFRQASTCIVSDLHLELHARSLRCAGGER